MSIKLHYFHNHLLDLFPQNLVDYSEEQVGKQFVRTDYKKTVEVRYRGKWEGTHIM